MKNSALSLNGALVVLMAAGLAGCGLEAGNGTDGATALDLPGRELVTGSFAARFDDTLRGGGVIAEGASLSGRGDAVANASAAITIAGIPAGATVQRALLYWAISGGIDTTATLNATGVTGVQVATAAGTCWGPSYNATFRADVTPLVTGNGVYTVAGLPSSTAAAGADTDGAALVVSYQNPTSGTRRRVMVRDGAISADGTNDVVSDTFAGMAVPFSSTGRLHMVVADGQSFTDGPLTFAGATIATDQWSGTDGALWDVRSYNVALASGLSSAVWTSTLLNDCMFHVAAVVDFAVAVCGDGVRTGGEACDQGNTTNGDGCASTCDIEVGWLCTGTPSVCTAVCGDGIRVGAEQCDQGNVTNGDGCSSTCIIESGFACTGSPSVCTTTCGDGIPAGVESCDDGGTAAGDGCSATCTAESGWICTGVPSVCTTTCGDGVPAGAEICDDGGTAAGDGCSATCTAESGWICTGVPSVCTTICGDAIPAGVESCDDGGTAAGDGCSATCTAESGWICTGVPSVCATTCGDGVPAGVESCDDGGTAAGDGCSATCTAESGWICTGVPSVCSTPCGDGVVAGAEVCDDGNVNGGDGCSATCAVEKGWDCSAAQPSVCKKESTGCGCGTSGGQPWTLAFIVTALAMGLGRKSRRKASGRS